MYVTSPYPKIPHGDQQPQPSAPHPPGDLAPLRGGDAEEGATRQRPSSEASRPSAAGETRCTCLLSDALVWGYGGTHTQRMVKTTKSIDVLYTKLEERKKHTADQKEQWVEAGMQEYELEQQLERMDKDGRSVRSHLSRVLPPSAPGMANEERTRVSRGTPLRRPSSGAPKHWPQPTSLQASRVAQGR